MKYLPVLLMVLLFISCNEKKQEAKKDEKFSNEVNLFLEEYSAEFTKLNESLSLALWESNTKIIEGDSSNAIKAETANEAFAKFTGSKENIDNAKRFFKRKEELDTLQVRSLNQVLFYAGNNPEIVSELVKRRIKAETQQTEKLFGFDFKIKGTSVSANDIDDILKEEKDLNKRLEAWNASKEVGKNLKAGLVELRELRNSTVRALGYKDYFSYQVSEYDMTVPAMLEMNKKLIRDVWPLYRELHTYARYEFAKKYGVKEVPDMLPAHWLPNRWGQEWSTLVNVPGVNLDSVLKTKGSEWLVKQAESFYVSLGFDSLPQVFWEKSSLYPLPADAKYKKNNHASAWHIDLNRDVRSLMSVVPNSEWYETTHHELGHIYYYLSYSNNKVPPILRAGANRAFHEAVGSMIGLAALQKPFLANLGLVDGTAQTDETQELLKEALNYIVFIPFSAGVMTEFEHDLYVNQLSKDEFNRRWWQLVAKYQGIMPPSERGEEFCDAASKTHINDDAAQYYDYALSYALLFQLHNHIATKILKQNPKATNYYGSKEVGDFLKTILSPGANCDWRKLLKQSTGKDLDGEALFNYFKPLIGHLKEVNKGRKYTLPEQI